MSIPGIYDATNPFYDALSIPISGFSIPPQFDTFLPDNQSDYACRFVLVPNPAKGASAWTMNGKYITIGVYRDQGRQVGRAGMIQSASWTRSGTTLTFLTANPHGLSVGDEADFTNINVPTIRTTVTSVIDSSTFTIRTLYIGGTSGGADAVCWPTKNIDYYNDNVVFRLLPSFQLVPYSVIQNIFNLTAPAARTNALVMYDIAHAGYVNVPILQSADFNYDLTISASSLSKSEINTNYLYNQQFDENGNPLILTYGDNGLPIPNTNVNSRFANKQISYNYQNALPDGLDDRVYIYDFYGLDINDNTRDPYYNNPIVYRDITNPNIFNNFAFARSSKGTPFYYGSFLIDAFGNKAIGVQYNNALVVRKQVLPVALDVFNKPIKQPTTSTVI